MVFKYGSMKNVIPIASHSVYLVIAELSVQ
jgi:hypothetical protein